MINDIENLNARTDTATDTSDRNGTQFDDGRGAGLPIRSSIKAGGPIIQHSEAKGLKVRSSVKAGGLGFNHSEAKGPRSAAR